LLELKDITVTFPGVNALKEVSLKIVPGKVHGIIGENGAGKTTLMKVLSGLQTANGGSIVQNGRGITFTSARDALNQGIAYVSQEGSLIPHFSGAENILLGAEPSSFGFLIDRKALETKAYDLLQFYFPEKEMNLHCPVSELPFASQKIVEILRALSMAASVLILDEPTSSLPGKDKDKLFSVVRALKQKGKAVIIISHILTEVLDISDEITVLRDGENVCNVEAHDKNEAYLIERMIGRKLTDEFATKRAEIRTPETACLEVKNWIGEKFACEEITILKGEIVGFIGLTGSGHHEFAESLFGLNAVKSGTLKINGKQIPKITPLKAYKVGMGLVPDQRMLKALLGDNSRVIENLSLINLKQAGLGHLPVIATRKEKSIAQRVCKMLSVRIYSLEQTINQLSGGNKQKVSIGKMLFGVDVSKKYSVLVFIEPTEGIDVKTKSEIHDIIANLSKNGVGVIVVSSDLLEIAKLSDRVIVFANNKISQEIRKENFSDNTFISAMSNEKA
jgi:ABC-type sugar transport system ATPase subunit